jgi:hypothetical protein
MAAATITNCLIALRHLEHHNRGEQESRDEQMDISDDELLLKSVQER